MAQLRNTQDPHAQYMQQAAQYVPNVPVIRQKTVSIDFPSGQKEFLINAWSLTEYNRNLPIVLRYIVSPLSILLGGLIGEGLRSAKENQTDFLQGIDFSETLPVALMQLISVLDNDGLTRLYHTMFAEVYYAGRSVTQQLDDIFNEDPFCALELLMEVLRVNLISNFTQRKGFSRLMDLMKLASLKPIFQSPSAQQ